MYLLKYKFKCANPKMQHFSERGHTNHEIFIGIFIEIFITIH